MVFGILAVRPLERKLFASINALRRNASGEMFGVDPMMERELQEKNWNR